MAYKKTVWKDGVFEKARTFKKQDNADGSFTLVPDFGQILQEGTKVNADTMNNIENGIENIEKQIGNIQAPVTSVNTKTGVVELKAVDIKTTSGATVESQLADMTSKQDFNTHAGDSTKHITNTERTTWNGKQDKLTISSSTASTSTSTIANSYAVKTAMDRANEAFQFASDGKIAVANAITAKGVSSSYTDTFSLLANKIGQINTGGFKSITSTAYSIDTTESAVLKDNKIYLFEPNQDNQSPGALRIIDCKNKDLNTKLILPVGPHSAGMVVWKQYIIISVWCAYNSSNVYTKLLFFDTTNNTFTIKNEKSPDYNYVQIYMQMCVDTNTDTLYMHCNRYRSYNTWGSNCNFYKLKLSENDMTNTEYEILSEASAWMSAKSISMGENKSSAYYKNGKVYFGAVTNTSFSLFVYNIATGEMSELYSQLMANDANICLGIAIIKDEFFMTTGMYNGDFAINIPNTVKVDLYGNIVEHYGQSPFNIVKMFLVSDNKDMYMIRISRNNLGTYHQAIAPSIIKIF